MKTGTYTVPRRCGHVAISKMIKALTAGSQTIEDLVSACGLCETTVRAYVLTFRKERVIYVADWELDRRGRTTRPAYSFGNQKDAVHKVVQISGALRGRKYRAGIKARQLAQTLSFQVAA